MKRFLILTALVSGFALAPQLASAQDWRYDNYGRGNVGSHSGVYNRSFNQSHIVPQRVPNYGFNVYRDQHGSFDRYNSGYPVNRHSRSGYVQPHVPGRYNGQLGGSVHR